MHVGEGDVCLRTRGGDCTDKGTVHFMKDGTLFGVCATSFGFFEAYVVCSQHGLSNLTYLGRRYMHKRQKLPTQNA